MNGYLRCPDLRKKGKKKKKKRKLVPSHTYKYCRAHYKNSGTTFDHSLSAVSKISRKETKIFSLFFFLIKLNVEFYFVTCNLLLE